MTDLSFPPFFSIIVRCFVAAYMANKVVYINLSGLSIRCRRHKKRPRQELTVGYGRLTHKTKTTFIISGSQRLD